MVTPLSLMTDFWEAGPSWTPGADGDRRLDPGQGGGETLGRKTRRARGEEVHDSSLGLFQQSGTWLFNLVAGGSCVSLSKEVILSECGRCHQPSPPVLGLYPFNKQSDFDLSAPGPSLRALSGHRHNVV